MYDWSQLTNYIFIVAICFQLNTLYFMFWESAFYRDFSATRNISSFHLIINIQCTLAVLVTTFNFVGKLSIQQIFALCMVEVFAFAINFSINLLGNCQLNQELKLSQLEEPWLSSYLDLSLLFQFESFASMKINKLLKNNNKDILLWL